MPLYEYHCDPCDRDFEALIRGRDDAALCPDCGGDDVAKRFSVPAAAQASGPRSGPLPVLGGSPGPAGGCGSGGCGSGMCSFD